MKRDKQDLVISILGVIIIILIVTLVVQVLNKNGSNKTSMENSKVESYYKMDITSRD